MSDLLRNLLVALDRMDTDLLWNLRPELSAAVASGARLVMPPTLVMHWWRQGMPRACAAQRGPTTSDTLMVTCPECKRLLELPIAEQHADPQPKPAELCRVVDTERGW